MNSLPSTINFDALLRELLVDFAAAVDSWKSGVPADETSLLNHVTGRLRRQRRKCDVGVKERMIMTAEFYELHRKGEQTTDMYGSDLAVTIQIGDGDPRKGGLLKTVLLQLKISSDYAVELQQSQLRQADDIPQAHGRCFVVAVDKPRLGYRIESVCKCLSQFQGQTSKTFHADEWTFLSEWIRDWFSCAQGLPSKPNDPRGIEGLLEAYRTPPPPDDLLSDVMEANLREPPVPAKGWLKYGFMQSKR